MFNRTFVTKLYRLKFNSVHHVLEALERFGNLEALDKSPFERFNVHIKRTYRNISEAGVWYVGNSQDNECPNKKYANESRRRGSQNGSFYVRKSELDWDIWRLSDSKRAEDDIIDDHKRLKGVVVPDREREVASRLLDILGRGLMGCFKSLCRAVAESRMVKFLMEMFKIF